MAKKKYKVDVGFNVKIKPEEKDGDFGPGTVIVCGEPPKEGEESQQTYEVRYEQGDTLSASDLPKRTGLTKHLTDTGTLVEPDEPEEGDDDED